METNPQHDDGTLAFLRIPPDSGNRHFNCDEINQQKLLNKEFYIIDFIENVKTRFGDNRYLVKIKYSLEDREEYARKFFTNSPEIKYILNEIRNRNAFPRKVTLRAQGTRYYIE